MRHRTTSRLRGTASGGGLTIESVQTQGRNDDRDVRTRVEEPTRQTGKRGPYHAGTESSRARPGGTKTRVAHRANTMPERRAHEPVPEAREHTTCPCPGHCPHMSLTGPIMRRLPCQVVSHRVWPVSIRDAQTETHTPALPNNLYPQNVISLANRPGPRLRRIRPSGAVLDSCGLAMTDVPRLSTVRRRTVCRAR